MDCGVVPPETRIAGGKEAKANSIPWQAHLNLTYENDKDWQGDCGAVILGSRHVLTAAHCTMKWINNEDGSWTPESLVEANMKVRMRP